MLNRKLKGAAAPCADGQPSDNGVTTILEDIAGGRSGASLSDGHPLAGPLKHLVDTLCNAKREDIDRAVAVSIQTSRAVVESARAVRELRQVNEKVEGMAAASEELLASVRELNDTSVEISNSTRQSHDATRAGAQAVQESRAAMSEISGVLSTTVERVERLNEFTRQIAAMADTIKTIASQTNMLSLNAAIEAARAGDVGRGFAVVAGEVRLLSAQTTDTTRNIDTLVENLQNEMNEITRAMEHSRHVVSDGEVSAEKAWRGMEDIKAQTAEMSDSVRQISEVLGQQASAAQDVADGITDIALRTTANVESIEQIVECIGTIDHSMDEWTGHLAAFDVPGKAIKLGKSDHVAWKKRLTRMLVGREKLNPAEMTDHHRCRFGVWYQSCTDAKYREHPSFTAIHRPHADVHSHGRQAATLFNAGNVAGALAEIEKMETASNEVLKHLDALDGLTR
ncbi:MAG: methyl-accepting chemotaxis protein [Rhizomicrobium sp.]|nr:methyl-accepting chemotaxis protein [Rhizomicrobium sp.]